MGPVLEQRTISLEGAQRVLTAALAEAERAGVAVSVAVSGRAGDLKAFARMDGAGMLSIETSTKKTVTVARVGRSTREFGTYLREEMDAEPELFHGMITAHGVVGIAGGVPIHHEGELVGAVAVSGASSDDDDRIASLAAAAVA